MKNKIIIIFLALIFFSLYGCLRSVEDSEGFEYQLIQEKLRLLSNQDCSCFVCTQSTGKWWTDLFTYNDLYSGGCYINKICTPAYIAEINEDEKSFLRTFDIGYGNSFSEYEEANLRSGGNLGIVLRELKQHDLPKSDDYILPIYKGDTNEVSSRATGVITLFDQDKIPAFRALEKNAIPIYYINSKNVDVNWMNNFFTDTEIAEGGKIFFIAVKSSADNSNDLINVINSKCLSEKTSITETKCVKYDWVESGKYDVDWQTPIYEKRCTQWDTKKVIETKCNSMLYVDYMVNESNVDYEKVFEQVDKILPQNLVGLDAFLIHVNITEDAFCHAGMPLVNAMNLSRTLMRNYGTKPSYLIVSIYEKCIFDKEKEREIAQNLFYSIYYMRMTGIMGMIYYDYLPDASAVSPMAGCPECDAPETFLKLTKHYSEHVHNNREPLLFDNDGHNISKVCDIMSNSKIMTVNMTEVDKNNIDRLNPSDIKASDGTNTGTWPYVLALPLIDYGQWDKIEDPEERDTISTLSAFECTDSYPNAHLHAERCGVSNYLTLAYDRHFIYFTCEKWYSMIDDFVSEGSVSINSVRDMDTNLMKKLAFAFVMPEYERKIMSDYEMQQYCYPPIDEDNPVYGNPEPCEIINDYVVIRQKFEGSYPSCKFSEIGDFSNV